MSDKCCSRCKEIKDTSEFNRAKKASDGLDCYCRPCRRAYAKSYNDKYLPDRRYGDQRLSGSNFYSIHYSMLQRCHNPNNKAYSNYGGRGIKVCQRWHDFTNFCDDMLDKYEHGLSIERIDNDGDYCPDNCEWIPRPKQCRNKRDTIYVTRDTGEKVSLRNLADEIGVDHGMLRSRYYRNGDNYGILCKPSGMKPPTHIPIEFKIYVWDNMHLKPDDYKEWLSINYPDHNISDQYIRQLPSNYRKGKANHPLGVKENP